MCQAFVINAWKGQGATDRGWKGESLAGGIIGGRREYIPWAVFNLSVIHQNILPLGRSTCAHEHDMPALGRSTYFSSQRFKIPYIHFSFSLQARVQIYGLDYTTQHSLYHRYLIRSQGGQETWVTSLAPLQWKSPEPSNNSPGPQGPFWKQCVMTSVGGGGAVNSSKTLTLSVNCKGLFMEPILGCDCGHCSQLYSIWVHSLSPEISVSYPIDFNTFFPFFFRKCFLLLRMKGSDHTKLCGLP